MRNLFRFLEAQFKIQPSWRWDAKGAWEVLRQYGSTASTITMDLTFCHRKGKRKEKDILISYKQTYMICWFWRKLPTQISDCRLQSQQKLEPPELGQPQSQTVDTLLQAAGLVGTSTPPPSNRGLQATLLLAMTEHTTKGTSKSKSQHFQLLSQVS